MKHACMAIALAMLALVPIRAQVTVDIDWANITGTPTSAAGYGIANGSNLDAWAAKTLPSGTVLGTTDTQTVTNKIINGANNTLTVRIGNDVTGLGTGVATALAGTLDSSGGLTSWAATAPPFAARDARQGIISTGVTFAGYTADNASLAFATSDFTPWVLVAIPDWTPSSDTTLYSKVGSGLGFAIQVRTTGVLRLQIGNGSGGYHNFDSTAATGLTDGNAALIEAVIDRDATLVWRVNGVQLGSPVSISSVAAQTVTSANPLILGGTTSSFAAGTYYAAGIVNGLTTPAQSSLAAARGSFAGLGLTMYQHLVPSDSLAAGIYEDISGNANHAVLGVSGISKVVPVTLPAASVADALRGDGSANTRIYSTLGTQNPGTGDFSFYWEFSDLDVATGTTKFPASLSNSTTEIYQARTLHWYIDTTVGLGLRLMGATTSDARRLTSIPLLNQIEALRTAGVRVGFVAVRSSGGMTIYMAAGGRVFNVSKLFTEGTGGTPPAWSDQVDGAYILGFYRNSTTSVGQALHALELLNVAVTSTDIEYRQRKGRWSDSVGQGTREATGNIAQNGGTASARAVVTFSGASATGFTAGGNSGGAGYAGIVVQDVKAGQRVTLTFTYDPNTVAATPGIRFIKGPDFVGSETDVSYTSVSGSSDMTGGAGTYTRTILATGPSVGGLYIGWRHGASTTGTFIVSNISVQITGVVTALDLQDGGGYQPKNPRRENGSTNWEMSTTGVDWAVKSPVGKRVSITKTYTHDQISSTSSTTAHGTLPAGWAVREVQLSRATAFDASTTLDCGTAAGSTLFTSAQALSNTGFNYADSSRKDPQSATAGTTIYIKKNQATTVGLATVTVIIERIF